MLDLGWSELIVVAVVALIVVGPKELPALLRTVGKFMRVIRNQANEFRDQFNQAIKDTEFEEVRKEFQDLKSSAESTVRDASREIENELRDLDEISHNIDREIEQEKKKKQGSVISDIENSPAQQIKADDISIESHNASILEAEERAKMHHKVSATNASDNFVDTANESHANAAEAEKDVLASKSTAK